MAKLFFFYVTVLLLTIGYLGETDCVSLQILSYTEEKYSECTSGVVDGKDKFIYSSTIDTTTFDISKRRFITFQMKRSTSDIYDPICRLNILSTVCTDSPQNGCYCKSNTSFVLDVILNTTANVLYSNSTVRLFLPDPITGNGDYSNNETVPVIQSDFSEVLTVDDISVNPGSCKVPKHQLKYCVTGLSSHKLRIFSDKQNFSEGENCVNHTFNSQSSLNSLNVSFIEYNNCQRSRTHVCYGLTSTITTVQTTDESTTTIPTTLNTTTATSSIGPSSNAENANNNVDNTGAIVGGVLGGVLFIALIVVIVVVAIKYKKRPGNININMNSGDVPLKDIGNHPTTGTENAKASNMASKPTKHIYSHSNVIKPEIESITEASAASSNGEERSKKRSKKAKKPKKDNTENDATRSASGVEVHFNESEDNSGKIKRPPSVEITNNPNPITPRPLPQSKAAGELPPIRNK